MFQRYHEACKILTLISESQGVRNSLVPLRAAKSALLGAGECEALEELPSETRKILSIRYLVVTTKQLPTG